MIKGFIHQKDKTILNKYAPNSRAPRFIKQLLLDLRTEIDRNTVIVKDFCLVVVAHACNPRALGG